jgi:hypothetical protein
MKREFRRSGPLIATLAIVFGFALGENPATTAARPLSAKQIANKVLKLDPRKPADIDLFTSTTRNYVLPSSG